MRQTDSHQGRRREDRRLHASNEFAALVLSPPAEPTEESALATRIAAVKVMLSVLNIGVILLDHTAPIGGTEIALAGSMKIALVFLVYMAVSYLAIRQHWVSVTFYKFTVPFLDVIFCSMLVLGTNGYMSPFNFWVLFAIVSAGFSSDQRIVLGATALGVALQILIAFLPQPTPLDIPVFVVRTAFVVAFGLVIAYFGNNLAKKSLLLGTVDSFAQKVAASGNPDSAAESLIAAMMHSLRPDWLKLDLDDGTTHAEGERPAKTKTYSYDVASGSVHYGSLAMSTRRLVSSDDELLIHTLLDRFSVALKRLTTQEELKRSAAQEARLRVADELHDTHLQTLAAIDFQVESTLGKLPEGSLETREDLQRIRSLARSTITGLREFISQGTVESTDDLDEIVSRARKNWSGTLQYEADPESALSRGAWNAIEVLIREGLINARQHAKAEEATFSLRKQGGLIIAALETNGATPELPLKRHGYGLTRVEASVAGAGGQMYISARPGGGAVLSAVFGERQA